MSKLEATKSDQDKSADPQVIIQEGAKTYDNLTEEIQQSWRTTYRD